MVNLSLGPPVRVSILLTFLAAFSLNCFFAAFLYLQFGFVIFWCKNIGAKGARKMLIKLTPGRTSKTFQSPLYVGVSLYLQVKIPVQSCNNLYYSI